MMLFEFHQTHYTMRYRLLRFKKETTVRVKEEIVILSDTKNNNQQGVLVTLLEFMIALFFLGSIYLAFFSCMTDELCQMVIALEAVVLLSILSILKLYPKVYRYVTIVGTFLVFGAFFGMYKSVIKGLVDFVNQLIGRWNQRFPLYHSTFVNDGVTSFDKIIFWSLLAVAITFFISSVIHKRKYYILGYVSFLVLFFTISFGLTVYGIPMILFVCAWVACWSYQLSKSRKSRQNVIIIVVFVGAFLGISVFATLKYHPFSAVSTAKEHCLNQINAIRYGTGTLTEGNIKKGNRLNQGNQKVLQVTSTDIPKLLHLKGYVGSKYENNQWKELDSSAYVKEEGIIKWLKENKFDANDQYHQFLILGAMNNQEALALKKMKISNVGTSRKFLYLPSVFDELKSESKYRNNQDWQVVSKEFLGTKQYQFTYLNENIQSELIKSPQWLTNRDLQSEAQMQYLTFESVYRNFVYNNYCKIGAKSEATIQRALNLTKTEEATIYSATKSIRQALERQLTVSDELKFTKNSKNYLYELLLKQKKGNSVAYATTATLAYRMLGFPARYVEGYYYKAKDSKKKSITLTTKDAHAWVEVYFDGIGWLPIEVTPGFYESDYTVKKDNQETSKPKEEKDDQKQKKNKDDSTDKPKDKKIKDESGPVFGLNQYIAIAILVIYGIMLIFLILELQRKLRLNYRTMKIGDLTTKKQTRYLFSYMCKLLKRFHLVVNANKPYEILEHWDSVYVKKESYERIVGIIQKNVFGELELKKNELRIIEYFYRKHRGLLYQNANILKKFAYRYISCL